MPVFVAGYPRSGTTLVYRILAQSPRFAAVRDESDAAHETAISVYMNPLTDLRQVYRQPWPGWRSVVTDDRSFDQFAEEVGRLSPPRRAVERWLTRHVFDDARFLELPRDVDSLPIRGWVDPAARAAVRRAAMRLSGRRRVIRQFLELYAQHAGAPRVLEKYPFNYYRFVELLAALPTARFVHVVRDPCDVFASMVHRARVELRHRAPIGRVSWMLLAADTFSSDWLTSVRAAQTFQRLAPDHLLILRYEQLVAEPQRMIDRLAAFADVDPADFVAAPGRDVADPTRRFPLTSAVPVANSGRYTSELDDTDIATIRRECAVAMAALGYPS